MTGPVVIREAAPADARDLRRLADLDSSSPPRGRALVAAVDGEIRAAVTFDGGARLADPFFRSAELIELLRVRAAQLRQEPPSRVARLMRWLRATRSTASPGASRPRSAAA